MRSVRTSLIAAVSLLLFTGAPTVANSAEPDQQMGVAREMIQVLEAYAVYKMGQYDLAFERYQALAEAWSRQGMYNLGIMHAAGQGTAQSDSKAFEWYLRAAEAGDKLSMSEVAKAYEAGIGTRADPQLARHWRERAATED